MTGGLGANRVLPSRADRRTRKGGPRTLEGASPTRRASWVSATRNAVRAWSLGSHGTDPQAAKPAPQSSFMVWRSLYSHLKLVFILAWNLKGHAARSNLFGPRSVPSRVLTNLLVQTKMAVMTAVAPIATIYETEAAAPCWPVPGLEILEQAAEPRSATQIAQVLGLTRQRTNYHVQALAKVGLLRKAGERRKRNFLEQQWQRSAQAYVLAPELLGAVAADWRSPADRQSAAHLMALSARTVSEVGRLATRAQQQDRRLSTLSLDVDIGFATAEERQAFSEALIAAVSAVVAEHTTAPGAGARAYRLVVGCHPLPSEETDE